MSWWAWILLGIGLLVVEMAAPGGLFALFFGIGAILVGAPGLKADLAGEVATVLADVPAGGVGKAELRGTPWEARSATGGALAKGQRCRVERVEGLMLLLRPE